MRIDYQYLKKILDICLNYDLPEIKWNLFDGFRREDEHRFVHHIELMADMGLIVPLWEDSEIRIKRRISGYVYPTSPIRLTAKGYDFASALTKPHIISVVSEKLNTEGLTLVMDLVMDMARRDAHQQLPLSA